MYVDKGSKSTDELENDEEKNVTYTHTYPSWENGLPLGFFSVSG